MADDALSDAELQSLLGGGAPRQAPAQRSGPRKPSAALPPILEASLKQALAPICQRCAVDFATALSSLVRRPAGVTLAGVTALGFREFVARVGNPACLNVLAAPSLTGHWLLEASPSILFPAIDCMLGGSGAKTPISARPLTEIERRLAARFTGLFVECLSAACEPSHLHLSVERTAASSDLAGLLKPEDVVIWVRFEIELAAGRGALHLVIPAQSLSAAAEKLVPARSEDGAPTAPSPAADGATVEIAALLAQAAISQAESHTLAVGDVITTDQKIDAPIAVYENGVPRFRARVGALDGRKALKIEEKIPDN
jgi:flagellar motor switch protein FliM